MQITCQHLSPIKTIYYAIPVGSDLQKSLILVQKNMLRPDNSIKQQKPKQLFLLYFSFSSSFFTNPKINYKETKNTLILLKQHDRHYAPDIGAISQKTHHNRAKDSS